MTRAIDRQIFWLFDPWADAALNGTFPLDQDGDSTFTQSATGPATVGTPASQPTTSPSFNTFPTTQQVITTDAWLHERMEDEYTRSDPGSTHALERGFWIMRKDATGEVTTRPFTGSATGHSLVPGPVPHRTGETAIGFFHTHPNPTSQAWEPNPSVADTNFAAGAHLMGIVRSDLGYHPFGAGSSGPTTMPTSRPGPVGASATQPTSRPATQRSQP